VAVVAQRKLDWRCRRKIFRRRSASGPRAASPRPWIRNTRDLSNVDQAGTSAWPAEVRRAAAAERGAAEMQLRAAAAVELGAAEARRRAAVELGAAEVRQGAVEVAA
jgi:hypothetical protein